MSANEAPITVTMLSCKRLHLFQKTFNSFINRCLDLDLVTNLILIDDNSSLEDRNTMQSMLSELNIPSLLISKNHFKGQAVSLNILSLLAPTRYSFHVEDDLSFKKSGHFIRDSLEIAAKHDFVKRVCVDAPSSGKNMNQLDEEILQLDSGAKYFIHTYKNKGYSWPSFTFRQGLVDNTIFKEIGPFRSRPTLTHDAGQIPTCESDYGVRYCEKGYRTAFLMEDYCEEIGKHEISSFILNSVNRHREA